MTTSSDGNTPLGDEAMDASSQLLVALTTDNPAEAGLEA